jgi:hypothetical protein
VSSEEEEEAVVEEEKDTGTPGRVEMKIVLKQDVDDLPMGSMEYTSFIKGFGTHLAVASGLEKEQFKIQDLEECEKFIPRFDPKTGLSVVPKEEQNDDPVMRCLVIFMPDVENRDNLEITHAAEVMKGVLENMEGNEDHALLKGQFGEMIYLDEVAKFTFYEFSEHSSDDEGGKGGGGEEGEKKEGEKKEGKDGNMGVDPETGKRHLELAAAVEGEAGKEREEGGEGGEGKDTKGKYAEEQEDEEELTKPFEFMFQQDDQDDGRAKIILPFRKDLSEMMPGELTAPSMSIGPGRYNS